LQRAGVLPGVRLAMQPAYSARAACELHVQQQACCGQQKRGSRACGSKAQVRLQVLGWAQWVQQTQGL
jgi:hypothetical protein